MSDRLKAEDFPAFFGAVHGVEPFPWQRRLLHQLAEIGEWPEVLDLPTGSGKTAALDIAVFHLALEARRDLDRRAAVRIAFVVDRRLIVDDAFTRARKLQAALLVPNSEIVGRVAAALRLLSGADEPPLLARRLRGGVPREDDWARTPSLPTILCSTVDQVGSRLLFRGYGISDRMKPVHAGLLGSDCVILLDEAHLAEPFRQTLDGIARLRQWQTATPPWHVALLSATPGTQPKKAFSLSNDDREHPVLSRRLRAPKPAELVEIANKQGVSGETRRIEEIAAQATITLDKLCRQLPNPAIGVIVNRVSRARQVFERLNQELPDTKLVLIIGPARPVEREEAAIRDLRPITTGGERRMDQPLILVATQTIEAGVDIDLDGLVTEAAALDALRQRFGRLNRAGREIASVAVILAHKNDIGSRADDAVYGDRIGKTWEALKAAAISSPEPLVEFGIGAFPSQLAENSDHLAAEKANAPTLLPAYADLWSQTWPIPNADPDVALFLHGPDRSPASVQIVWRADLDPDDFYDGNRVAALLDLIPPRSGEAIEIPLWAARAWLRAEAAPQAALSDIAERAPEEASERRGRRAFRYAGSDDERRTRAVFADELRNGDLMVAPASYGGCDQWGWAPSSEQAVNDLAEAAAEPYARRRFAVRVTAELIRQSLVEEQRQAGGEDTLPSLDVLRRDLLTMLAEHRDQPAPELLDAVLGWAAIPPKMKAWLELLEHRNRKGRLERVFAYGDLDGQPRGVVFLAASGIQQAYLRVRQEDDGASPVTEDDGLSSSPGYNQSLEAHSCDVSNYAGEFARRDGVMQVIAEDIALAGYLHDAGKADPRFQAMLYGGDWFAVDETKILAKSARRFSPAAWSKAELPEKWRHEALSVRIAREHPRFREANDKELVLWLIGVHHGYGRPLFPHTDPCDVGDRDDLSHIGGERFRLTKGAGPQSLAFDFDGRDWAQIFERLKWRYGVWELARMEAIVRLADHRASEAAAERSLIDDPK